MRKFWIVGFFAMFVTVVEASHIVGGEMALVHVEGSPYTYKLELILYYDLKNGLTGGDLTIRVRIFRKRDHQLMISSVGSHIELTTSSTIGTPVEYFQPLCSDGSIETNRVFYVSGVFTLSPDVFNDPEGYYLAWERCCRNYNITNIYSENPQLGASYQRIAGQIFYLEIPPVIKNGEPFINSSPRLFPPLSDYACPNRPYFVDFAGTDPEGDSLVYSMATPINSKTRDSAFPPGDVANPGPYDSVTWKPGFGINNIMNGIPDLKISNDGLLTVTPSAISAGIYVFAVRCEEFRDGVKIGEVRRDFQMLVQDACPVAEPPVIVGRKKGDALFSNPNQTVSLSFSNSVPDENRCVEVQVSDPDSEKFDDNFQERVSVKVIPLNFKTDKRFITDILPTVSTATLTNGSTVTFDICLPQCPYVPNGNYQIGIIAFDDACTLPLSDTLRITVFVEPPPNNKPAFDTPNTDITVNEGDPAVVIPIHAVDADVDTLDAFVITDGFILPDVGMTLSLDASQPGEVAGELVWDTHCDVYDFTKKTNFNFKILVDDRDFCSFTNPDTMTIALHIILPGNSDPVISSSLQTSPDEKIIEVTRKIYETLDFEVTGIDADNDLLILGVTGLGFNPTQFNAGFPGDTDRGFVTSAFSWFLNCDAIDLDEKDEFEFRFIVVDNANKCRFYKADTLNVIVHVEPPDNAAPELTITSENTEQPLENGSLTAILGSPISLQLTGFDADMVPSKDNLKLELIGQSGTVEPSGFEFENVEGASILSATFTWEPDCSIFKNGIYENQYTFTFRLSDERCFNEKADTVEVAMTIKDVDGSDEEFQPPNFFSPNGDESNPYFAMVKWDDVIEAHVNILPLDNCVGRFVSVQIYNRWGRQVFESADRNFRWYGEGMPNGVYYYLITYTNREFRGSVTLRF